MIAEEFGCEDTFVIGGGLTYSQFAPLVDRYLVTVVEHQVEEADAYVSQDILSDLRKWDRVELAKYPAVPDQDDYAFAVYELWAPDTEARAAKRSRLIENYRSKVGKKPKLTRRSSKHQFSPPQDAFAF